MNQWWNEVIRGVQQDFSDLGNPALFASLIVRLLVSGVLGALIGLQRETIGQAAGLRTHMLVALGAAVFAFVGQQSGMGHDATSRVMQGIITGVGFLGAGAILKMTEQGQIHGLTTAAGIWMTAAIGTAAGMGRELTAIVSTLITWIVLALFPALERRFGKRPR